MLSEACGGSHSIYRVCVCVKGGGLSTGGRWSICTGGPLSGGVVPGWRPPGSHCSGRYASYWNAFLFRNFLKNLC